MDILKDVLLLAIGYLLGAIVEGTRRGGRPRPGTPEQRAAGDFSEKVHKP